MLRIKKKNRFDGHVPPPPHKPGIISLEKKKEKKEICVLTLSLIGFPLIHKHSIKLTDSERLCIV